MGRAGLFLGLEDNLVRVAVTAEMDDLGLVLVELANQVDRPRTRDENELHDVAERASADFLVDLPELPGQIKRGCPNRVGGKEQDPELLHPTSDAARIRGLASVFFDSPATATIQRAMSAQRPAAPSGPLIRCQLEPPQSWRRHEVQTRADPHEKLYAAVQQNLHPLNNIPHHLLVPPAVEPGCSRLGAPDELMEIVERRAMGQQIVDRRQPERLRRQPPR